MTDMVIAQTTAVSSLLPLPAPRCPVTIRAAVAGDLGFIDRLQKMHTHAVGWMPTQQLEGSIQQGRILVAWASRPPLPCSDTGETPVPREEPVGYLMGADRYFKRDDVGIIYQMNVLPGKQRGYVGAALLKEQFERSAYGCRLFCCWCAQDLEANHFWESLGFVPLAFRTGSRRSVKGGSARGGRGGRVHIFWQKRIRAGDTTTPWWFPSQTSGGAIREDRIALPIPPGTHWSDAKPVVLPGVGGESEGAKGLPAPKRARVKKPTTEPLKPTAACVGWVAVRACEGGGGGGGGGGREGGGGEAGGDEARAEKEERSAAGRGGAGAARSVAGAGERDTAAFEREI